MTDIDRFRGRVDHFVDESKVNTDSTDPIDIRVSNEFGVVSRVAYVILPVAGSATAKWHSAPDGVTPDVIPVIPIAAGLVGVDKGVTASVNLSEVIPMTAQCRLKTNDVLRPDTKPSKRKDYDRGRCSAVAEPWFGRL